MRQRKTVTLQSIASQQQTTRQALLHRMNPVAAMHPQRLTADEAGHLERRIVCLKDDRYPKHPILADRCGLDTSPLAAHYGERNQSITWKIDVVQTLVGGKKEALRFE